MDTFFQKLRDIQKKERNTGTLSEVDDSFYTDASNYLQELLKMVNNNPLSLEAYQLRDAQRITTEICERREFKIVSTAATNVQKGHDIFKGHKKDSELYDVIPYNTTPEEEEFYRKIVDMLIDHREHLMDKIVLNRNNETKIGFKPVETKTEQKQKDNNIKPENDDTTSIKTEIQDNHEETPIGTDDASSQEKKSSKTKTPLLDETQIAMMFGQAPDDILLDENNNPVKPIKKDITTPFKGPKAPKEDTITLQNNTKTRDQNEEKTDETITDETITEETITEETIIEDSEIEQTTKELYENEELVEFKKEITTDILDENEKTYGPFSIDDIVLLPKSIVKILKDNEVIQVIK